MDKHDFIFGRQPILEMLRRGETADRIVLQQGIEADVTREVKQLARTLDIPVQVVPKSRLMRITRKNHQGVIAFTRWVEYSNFEEIILAEYERGSVPLVLLLDQITDVRNVGAIARSAEVFDVTVMMIPAKRSAPLNADAVKTSAGAILRVPVSRVHSLARASIRLREMGLTVYATDQKADKRIQDIDFTHPAAIVLGSEKYGIHPRLLEAVDASFAIPQAGEMDSLNVSVAAGIALYEVTRQRGG